MTATKSRAWVSATVPPEVAHMMDQVAAANPSTESRSDILRHGIRLALREAVDRGIDDKDLEHRILKYLHTDTR